ncbi:sigma-70 family RNA polymerase sigma factor [Pseudonocardia sp. RS11V-5]|uniref:RNA polymerase sigma factor n=1 Tax=Pseudonocardia terrae TaxID=2905831 RepID=UPI001E28CCB0|nr:sigma-70 family RNA polymerase sigma factor [Pseudonocardia terrae]MCE3552291.1 sigma-70 family RNA polymerase sigma factor [Pseudonocardia terrae]
MRTRGAREDVCPPPVPAAPQEPGPLPAERELDDTTLVVRAREGDVRAFSVLAQRHQAALYRLALRLVGNAADAEDALQESLLDAWRRLDRFRGDSAFTTWAYRIVTNRCLDLLRRRRATVSVEQVAEVAPERLAAPEAGAPEHAAEVDAGLAALRAALRTLPDDQRACFVLRELEGLGYAEIAEITGASETAVRGRLHRARRGLAEVMRSWR